MKKYLLLIPPVIFFIIFTIFFYLLIIERNPSTLPSVFINKKAPIFKTMSLYDNKILVSNREFGNEIVLVNFFATWCVPCKDEHRFIKKLSNEHEIKIIGINYKDKSDITKKWLKELGNPYEKVGIDKNGNIGIEWGVYGIPETYIVDKNSIVKYKYVGPINKQTYKKIVSQIHKLK